MTKENIQDRSFGCFPNCIEALFLRKSNLKKYVSIQYAFNVELKVEEVKDGAFKVESNELAKVYDIKLIEDGNEIQPRGKVTVMIPLPNGFNPGQTSVYYINADNERKDVNAHYDNGFMVFEIDHFSRYAVV